MRFFKQGSKSQQDTAAAREDAKLVKMLLRAAAARVTTDEGMYSVDLATHTPAVREHAAYGWLAQTFAPRRPPEA